MWIDYCYLYNACYFELELIECDCRHSHSLLWRHNGRHGVSNHQPHDCLLSRSIRRRSKRTSKLRVTGLCAGNSPVTGEFPAQMASNAENVSIWWRHCVIGDISLVYCIIFRPNEANSMPNIIRYDIGYVRYMCLQCAGITIAPRHKCNLDEIFVISCTESCQNDNFQCSQWRQFHQNDISVSMYMRRITDLTWCECEWMF